MIKSLRAVFVTARNDSDDISKKLKLVPPTVVMFWKKNKLVSIPLINSRVQLGRNTIVAIINSQVVFTSDCKVFHVTSCRGVYALVEREFFSWIVQLVNKRVCVESVTIAFIVGDGEKKISIDAKLFNSNSSFGRQILIFFKEMQATEAILGQEKKSFV